MPTVNGKSLESWIWDAACSILGAKDTPQYKDYILPLIFAKRLCDVFDDEINRIHTGDSMEYRPIAGIVGELFALYLEEVQRCDVYLALPPSRWKNCGTPTAPSREIPSWPSRYI